MSVRHDEGDVQVARMARSPAVAKVAEDHRATLRAEARRDAARRELRSANDELQEARTSLWRSVREARDSGVTLADIASVIGVSIQRVSALARKPERAARR
jgi:hypothetical protein